MRYALAGALILGGITAIGIGWNNNGWLLFSAWGALIRQRAHGATAASAAIATASQAAGAQHAQSVTPGNETVSQAGQVARAGAFGVAGTLFR